MNAEQPISASEAPTSGATTSLQLFDIAEAGVQDEAETWKEEAGLNLYLEDTIALVKRELEAMPSVCAARTGVRARVFVVTARWSDIVPLCDHYRSVAQYADVWIFGVADTELPELPHVQVVPLAPGVPLARERTVVVDSPVFGAALFVREAGLLEADVASSRYFEGFLTARVEAVEAAARRLGAAVELPPVSARNPDIDLTLSWYSRLNTRFLENLEGQKLALRGLARELDTLKEEHRRQESLMRGYVGGQTWKEVQQAVEQGHSVVADWREELSMCFCDLVGFTPLSERLHPTEVAAILNEHFANLAEIVRAHGGWIDKFMGDAMLAVFAGEDSAAEAFIAAQKMVRESRKVKVTEFMEVPVAVRVGVNTGLVAVANLGVPEHKERTVLGDAVNLAQRLQSVAQPHTVVLSESTFAELPVALAGSLEPFEVSLKGKTGLVKAYIWTLHSHRQATERSTLRESLSSAGRRAPLADRLPGRNRPRG